MKKINPFRFTALLMAMLFMAMTLMSCATFTKNSYITMDATGVTYNTVMTATGAATTSGKITADQRAKINAAGLIFYNGYQVAVDGLIAYSMNPSTTTQGAIQLGITTMLANWTDMANLINSIIPGAVPSSSLGTVFLRGKTTSGQRFTVSIKKLDSGEISVIIQIGAAVISYLLPAIQSLIADIGKVSISTADITALKPLIKTPDQY